MRTHAGLGASGEPPPARGGQTCDQAPAHAVLPVTNRYKSRHPTSTRPAVTANAARLDPTTPRPRRARRPPGWPDTRIAAAGRAGCGIPPASPKGYHTAAQGQSHMTHAPVLSRAAPGPPRGRAVPGSSYISVKGFGVVSSSGFDGHGLERAHQPRCARLRRFRVDPPAAVLEAARTTRTGAG
jgi:hypothetical protein